MSTMSTGAPRPKGRPAQFDRDRALDQLCLLLWTRGYDAATQEEMLAATGLSSSSLYRSFGTKADILEASLKRYLSWADVLFAPLECGSAGLSDVLAFLDSFRQQISGPLSASGCLVWNTMQLPVNDDPRIRALTDQHMQRLRSGLTAALNRAVEAGELHSAAPAYLRDVLRAGILGVQARGRAGEAEDALQLIEGLEAMVKDQRRRRISDGPR